MKDKKKKKSPQPHAAVGVAVVATHEAHELATEGARMWLRGWNEAPAVQRRPGWEPLELITAAALPVFGDYGVPVALLRGESGANLVLFFNTADFPGPTFECQDPEAIGFDVSAFKVPAAT